ncbi:MAG: hypothetical protein ACYC25_17020 [Paludibacter sp.]
MHDIQVQVGTVLSWKGKNNFFHNCEGTLCVVTALSLKGKDNKGLSLPIATTVVTAFSLKGENNYHSGIIIWSLL